MTKNCLKSMNSQQKNEAMQFIRRLELANDKRVTEYFLREVDE